MRQVVSASERDSSAGAVGPGLGCGVGTEGEPGGPVRVPQAPSISETAKIGAMRRGNNGVMTGTTRSFTPGSLRPGNNRGIKGGAFMRLFDEPEMPPLGLVGCEAVPFHRGAQLGAVGGGFRRNRRANRGKRIETVEGGTHVGQAIVLGCLLYTS